MRNGMLIHMISHMPIWTVQQIILPTHRHITLNRHQWHWPPQQRQDIHLRDGPAMRYPTIQLWRERRAI